MKNILFSIIIALIMGCAAARDSEQVSCVVNGKPVQFTPEARTNLVEQSVGLLASCGYMDAKPKWGAPTEPQSIADARKQSHLDFTFASPRTVEVPVLKTTVRVKEMVISLPLAVGGIWVRTDAGVSYFAMYEYTKSQSIDKLLKEAQKP
jgi:hypothetical protein